MHNSANDPMRTVMMAMKHSDPKALQTASDAIASSTHPRAELAKRLAAAAMKKKEAEAKEPEQLSSDKVGKKIAKIEDEGIKGHPASHKQAVAVALDMKRRHKLSREGGSEEPHHFAVLSHADYEGSQLHGVHPTLEAAQDHVREMRKEKYGAPGDYQTVQEFSGKNLVKEHNVPHER